MNKMKQSKETRKQERLRKLAQKRETFIKLFFKRWCLLLLGAAVVAGIATYGYYQYYKLSVYRRANDIFTNLASRIQSTTYEDDKNDFIQGVRINLAKAVDMENETITGSASASYILMDSETRQVVGDSRISVFLTVEEGGTRTIYSCQEETAERIYKDYLALKESDSNSVVGYAESYYPVDEYDIIPAVVEFKDISGSIVKTVDYSPENERDYVRVAAKGGGMLTFYGHGLENQADTMMRSFASEHAGSGNAYDMEVDALPFGTVGFYFEQSILQGEDRYYLCGMSIYSISDKVGYILVISYILLFLLATGIALALAYRTRLLLKVRYQMEDERRQLTNAMAHDLKSPLMAISGYAENLKDNVHTEKREHYAEAITDSVQYMNGIISNVLDLAKLEEGNIKFDEEPIDLIKVLQGLAEHYQPELEKKQISLALKGACPVKGNRQLLTQALDNLISNCVKYTPSVGSIAAEGGSGKLRIQNDSIEQPGLEPEALLQPFVKGDNSRGNQHGSGVGLAIVKTIADLHGFKMDIHCDEDRFVVEWEVLGGLT